MLDPQHGRRRRAVLGDQVTHAKRLIRERAQGGMIDTKLEPDKPVDTPQSVHQLGR